MNLLTNFQSLLENQQNFKIYNESQQNLQQQKQKIIGIVTQESLFPSLYDPQSYSYIPKSYVQFVEGAGAQVIPIHYQWNQSMLLSILNQVNGVLFPGGDSEFHLQNQDEFNQLSNTTKFIMEYAFNANSKGDFFPVFGICQGFEIILVVMANDKKNKLLDSFENLNVANNITFVNWNSSYFFKNMSDELLHISQEGRPYYHWHNFGITPKTFFAWEQLSQLFRITSIGYDTNGKMFVGSYEAKEGYPIYATQFHPEKNKYEWKSNRLISHDFLSLKAAEYFATKFINDARNNKHFFEDQNLLQQLLIHNYKVERVPSSFMKAYFFEDPTLPAEEYQLNQKPLIGMLTEPLIQNNFVNDTHSLINFQIQNFVNHHARAQVVNLDYNKNFSYLQNIVSQINGFIIPIIEEKKIQNAETQSIFDKYVSNLKEISNFIVQQNFQNIYQPLLIQGQTAQQIVISSIFDNIKNNRILSNKPKFTIQLENSTHFSKIYVQETILERQKNYTFNNKSAFNLLLNDPKTFFEESIEQQKNTAVLTYEQLIELLLNIGYHQQSQNKNCQQLMCSIQQKQSFAIFYFIASKNFVVLHFYDVNIQEISGQKNMQKMYENFLKQSSKNKNQEFVYNQLLKNIDMNAETPSQNETISFIYSEKNQNDIIQFIKKNSS